MEITRDEQGVHVALPESSLSVLGEGNAFLRNGIKPWAKGGEQRTRWIVGELDGVRVYVNGPHVILTKQDLYP